MLVKHQPLGGAVVSLRNPNNEIISSILYQTSITVHFVHQQLKMNSSWQLRIRLTLSQPQYELRDILVVQGKPLRARLEPL